MVIASAISAYISSSGEMAVLRSPPGALLTTITYQAREGANARSGDRKAHAQWLLVSDVAVALRFYKAIKNTHHCILSISPQ